MNDTTTITRVYLRRLEAAAERLRLGQPKAHADIFEVDNLLFVGGPLDGHRLDIQRYSTSYDVPADEARGLPRREYRRNTLTLNLPDGTARYMTVMAYYG